MKKSEFREFVKEMFIDLINNDDETKEIVLEFIKENSGLIVESTQRQVIKEPEDPDLYDKLVLIASGQEKKIIFEGKKIETPNYGVGFKNKKRITEWTDRVYAKVGGKWRESANNDALGVNNDTMSFLSAIGGAGGHDIRSVAKSSNDNALKESIIKSGRGSSMGLTEDGKFDPNQSIDISDILADTAKTTLQSFPSSHEGTGLSNMNIKHRESFSGTPEQAFGAAAGNWASLAFNGMNVDGE